MFVWVWGPFDLTEAESECTCVVTLDFSGLFFAQLFIFETLEGLISMFWAIFNFGVTFLIFEFDLWNFGLLDYYINKYWDRFWLKFVDQSLVWAFWFLHWLYYSSLVIFVKFRVRAWIFSDFLTGLDIFDSNFSVSEISILIYYQCFFRFWILSDWLKWRTFFSLFLERAWDFLHRFWIFSGFI